jgi:hypothetical protein
MKTIFTLWIALLLNSLSYSQVHMDDLILNYNFQTPVVSLINLKTGVIESKTNLKELPVQVVYLNREDKAIYVMTKHFLYKIDALTGDVLVEYEYQETLIQKESDLIDPNLYLVPQWFGEDGIGLYFNMDEEIQARIKREHPYTTLFKINCNTQSKDIFAKVDKEIYTGIMAIDNRLYMTKKDLDRNQTASLSISNLEEFKIIEEISLPIDLTGNSYGLTNEMLYAWSLTNISGDRVELTLSPKMEAYPAGTGFTYTFDRKENKAVGLEKVNVYNGNTNQIITTIDSEQNYTAELDCPEKPTMPAAPETYIPKKYNKKAREEMARINDERLKEYQKKLDEWSAQINDNSACEMKLFKEENGERKELKTFYGTQFATVYYDRYVYYYDGLENVMFDLETDAVIWSIN